MKLGNILIIGIIVLIIIVIIVLYNNIIVKRKKVERNRSLIDVYLKKRFDLIPNLVEVCKGYSKFESQSLEKIIKLRTIVDNNPSDDNNSKLSEEYQKLIGLIENYPDLKASENYLKLQKEMINIENEIQASRRIYINSITSYNNYVMMFPISLMAKIIGYHQIELPKFDYGEIKINI